MLKNAIQDFYQFSPLKKDPYWLGIAFHYVSDKKKTFLLVLQSIKEQIFCIEELTIKEPLFELIFEDWIFDPQAFLTFTIECQLSVICSS